MNTKTTSLRALTLLAPVILGAFQLTACGGGGGGGSSANYSGTWAFQGTKVSDSCRSSLSQTISTTLLVTQNGSSVTVQSGSLTLTGEVNDRDGFDTLLTRPGRNGCVEGVSITMRNASDGTADTGFAIGAQCGSVTCTVGYGGVAVRSSSRSSQTGVKETNTEELTSSVTTLTTKTDQGVEGGLMSALEEAQMEMQQR